MNILHLEASPGWGGQEIRILREAEGMRSRHHQVVFAVMRGGRLIQEARSAGFTVYEMPFQKLAWPMTIWRLFTIMRRHGIDLVNTHSSLDSWIGAIAARSHAHTDCADPSSVHSHSSRIKQPAALWILS